MGQVEKRRTHRPSGHDLNPPPVRGGPKKNGAVAPGILGSRQPVEALRVVVQQFSLLFDGPLTNDVPQRGDPIC